MPMGRVIEAARNSLLPWLTYWEHGVQHRWCGIGRLHIVRLWYQ